MLSQLKTPQLKYLHYHVFGCIKSRDTMIANLTSYDKLDSVITDILRKVSNSYTAEEMIFIYNTTDIMDKLLSCWHQHIPYYNKNKAVEKVIKL